VSAYIFRQDQSFRRLLYKYLMIEMYDPTDLQARELIMDELYAVIDPKKVSIIDA
jgi:hypothetical protein